MKPTPPGADVESVERFVVEQLAAWEVPGCAVAAVRDGRVELARGWGLRDREAGLPVTQDTLFAIGSVTKAFTATTVGALVDEGLLEWDRPLRDYVPGAPPARTLSGYAGSARSPSASPAARPSTWSPSAACASACRTSPPSRRSSNSTTTAR